MKCSSIVGLTLFLFLALPTVSGLAMSHVFMLGPILTGACCFQDGSCLVLEVADCDTAGGIYQGDFTLCNPDPCAPPTVACCFSDGSCEDLLPEDCIPAGGLPGNPGSTCAGADCGALAQNTDHGDAPDIYPVYVPLGAAHVATGPKLGALVDVEPDGQPDPLALGDDLNLIFTGGPDDEDGVLFPEPLVRGKPATILVIASGTAALDAWIDFDGDGWWAPAERLTGSPISLAPSTNPVSVTVPTNAVVCETFARFRISTAGGLGPDGLAGDGEVEDYRVEILQAGPTNSFEITNITVNVTTASVEWVAESGVAYQLQREDTLGEPPAQVWSDIGAPVIGPANAQIDPDATVPLKAYRVVAPCVVLAGACCFTDGSCQDLTEAECKNAGGLYQGDFTSCNPNPCPQPPTGSCCFQDGSCQLLTETDCSNAGGNYGGDNTPCAPNPCPQPFEACCFTDGSCVDEDPGFCEAILGGLAQGPGTDCGSIPPCFGGLGACCFQDGSCIDATEFECDGYGGLFGGSGTSCEPDNPCPQPFEACCYPDGWCEDLPADDCLAFGGQPQGQGTDCGTFPCQAPEACCFDDGSCQELFFDDCIFFNGHPQGPGSLCLPEACPQPFGACCMPDGSCVDLNEDDCLGSGGEYQGDFSFCGPDTCPQPVGACCMPEGGCVEVTENECVGLGGDYFGEGTTCDQAPCDT